MSRTDESKSALEVKRVEDVFVNRTDEIRRDVDSEVGLNAPELVSK